jgi:signal transduction histidine kinase
VTELPPLPWLGPRESLNVLRIFQEAVSNVVQHAGAATITVRTAVRADPSGSAGVAIEICDDGAGVAAIQAADSTAARVSTSEGFGIQSMKRRAAELGGTLVVLAARPGTSVVLWLPLAGNGSAGQDA